MKTAKLPTTSTNGLASGSLDVLPERITVSRIHGALRIDWKWEKRWTFLSGVAAFAWTLWTGVAFISSDIFPWFLALFLGVPGFVVMSASVVMFFNKTRVEVTQRAIHIRTGPLWRQGGDITRDNFQQLFVKKTDDGEHTSFSVAAQTPYGEVDLVPGLDNAEQGRVVERLIEDFLDIENRPEPNEYDGD